MRTQSYISMRFTGPAKFVDIASREASALNFSMYNLCSKSSFWSLYNDR